MSPALALTLFVWDIVVEVLELVSKKELKRRSGENIYITPKTDSLTHSVWHRFDVR